MIKETKQEKLAVLKAVVGELLDIVDEDTLLNEMEEISKEIETYNVETEWNNI